MSGHYSTSQRGLGGFSVENQPVPVGFVDAISALPGQLVGEWKVMLCVRLYVSVCVCFLYLQCRLPGALA